MRRNNLGSKIVKKAIIWAMAFMMMFTPVAGNVGAMVVHADEEERSGESDTPGDSDSDTSGGDQGSSTPSGDQSSSTPSTHSDSSSTPSTPATTESASDKADVAQDKTETADSKVDEGTTETDIKDSLENVTTEITEADGTKKDITYEYVNENLDAAAGKLDELNKEGGDLDQVAEATEDLNQAIDQFTDVTYVDQPVYEKDAEGNLVLDENNNPKPVYETDAEGNVLYATDAEGNPIYATDAEGNPIQDENGQPVRVPVQKTEKVAIIAIKTEQTVTDMNDAQTAANTADTAADVAVSAGTQTEANAAVSDTYDAYQEAVNKADAAENRLGSATVYETNEDGSFVLDEFNNKIVVTPATGMYADYESAQAAAEEATKKAEELKTALETAKGDSAAAEEAAKKAQEEADALQLAAEKALAELKTEGYSLIVAQKNVISKIKNDEEYWAATRALTNLILQYYVLPNSLKEGQTITDIKFGDDPTEFTVITGYKENGEAIEETFKYADNTQATYYTGEFDKDGKPIIANVADNLNWIKANSNKDNRVSCTYTIKNADGSTSTVTKYYNYHTPSNVAAGDITVVEKNYAIVDGEEVEYNRTPDTTVYKSGDTQLSEDQLNASSTVTVPVGEGEQATEIKVVKTDVVTQETQTTYTNTKTETYAPVGTTITDYTYEARQEPTKEVKDVAGINAKQTSDIDEYIKSINSQYSANNQSVKYNVTYTNLLGHTVTKSVEDVSGWDQFKTSVYDFLGIESRGLHVSAEVTTYGTETKYDIVETVKGEVQKATVKTDTDTASGDSFKWGWKGDFDGADKKAAESADKIAQEYISTHQDVDNGIVITYKKEQKTKWSVIVPVGYYYEITYTIKTTTTTSLGTQTISTTKYAGDAYNKNIIKGQVQTGNLTNVVWTDSKDATLDEKNNEAYKNALKTQQDKLEAYEKTLADANAAKKAVAEAAEAAEEARKEVERLQAQENESVRLQLEEAQKALKAAEENLETAEAAAADAATIRNQARVAYERAVASLSRFNTSPSERYVRSTPATPAAVTPVTPATPAAEAPVVIPEAPVALAATPEAAPASGNRTRGNATGNTDDTEELAEINDEPVAQAATIEEDTSSADSETLATIEDEDPALADTMQSKSFGWWWLLIVAAIGGGSYVGYRQYKKNKEADEEIQ